MKTHYLDAAIVVGITVSIFAATLWLAPLAFPWLWGIGLMSLLVATLFDIGGRK